MKLGLSQACYRWVFYRHLRRDTPQYLDRGWPLPYFSAIPVAVDEAEAVDFLIDRCIHYRLDALHLEARRLVEHPDARDKLRRMADQGIEWISAASANWVATGDEADRDFEQYAGALRTSAALGAKVVCTTHGAPNVHNHFTRQPPIERQIELIAGNFRRAAQAAEDLGIVIALENHLDYRASEVAAVIEQVASPALRANFDTANPIGVIEDPVDAARAIGRHAVMCHLKDFRVQAMTTIGLPQIHWAPIGRGSVDFDRILPILQQTVPDPTTLRLCVEVAPLPEHDPDQWVAASIALVRERFGRYLTS